MRTDVDALVALPGPRRFFSRITQAVEAGQTVMVIVPKYSVQSGLAARVRSGIEEARCVNASIDLDLLTRCGGSLPEAACLAAHFMEPLSTSSGANRWQAYLDHGESRGKSVLATGWDGLVPEDISYWLRLIHSSSLDPETRPTFVFLVRDTDVDVETLSKEHSPHLSVLWWWDVLGLLDSELSVDLALSEERITPLRRAMLAESISWELHLAESCAKLWGPLDVPSVLVKVLREQTNGTEFDFEQVEIQAVQTEGKTEAPPRQLRSAWNAGYVNSWEGRIEPSTQYLEFSSTVERRFWSAQVRILMPFLERYRQWFAQRFEKLASKNDVAEISGESGLLELGKMLKAHHRKRVDFGRVDEQTLKLLVMVRNRIAHHESLNDDLYVALTDICV